MPSFNERSKRNLSQCHIDIQRLFNEVIKEIDCSVICGRRGKDEQNWYFDNGKSKVKFPYSKHNKEPSDAGDVVPCPLDWNDIDSFKRLGKVVLRKADEMEINIEWGGHWKNFKDYPHYQRKI